MTFQQNKTKLLVVSRHKQDPLGYLRFLSEQKTAIRLAGEHIRDSRNASTREKENHSLT